MTALETLKARLRDRRLKEGIDYAILKRGDVYKVLCCGVWEDAIWEEANAVGLKVEFYMFGIR